jgi:hypothetical protein
MRISTMIGTFAGSSLLIGCASNHNLQKDGLNLLGGGYYESTLAKGIHHISVKTNFAPWVNRAGAANSWRARAATLCGPAGFQEADVSEGYYYQGPPPYDLLPYIITTRDGYAVCKDLGLTLDEAMASIGRPKVK